MQSRHRFLETRRLFAVSLVATAFSLLLICLFAEIARVDAASEEEGQDSLTFVVLGDPQLAEEDVLWPMIRKIKAASPGFVLITGDCVMARGSDPEPWDHRLQFGQHLSMETWFAPQPQRYWKTKTCPSKIAFLG